MSSSITHVVSSLSTAIPAHVLNADPRGLTCKLREEMGWEGGGEGEGNWVKEWLKVGKKKEGGGETEWLLWETTFSMYDVGKDT